MKFLTIFGSLDLQKLLFSFIFGGNASQLMMKCIKFSALKLLAVLSKKNTKYALFKNCPLDYKYILKNFHHTSIDTLNYDFFLIQGQDEILDSNKKEELRVKSQSWALVVRAELAKVLYPSSTDNPRTSLEMDGGHKSTLWFHAL